MVIGEWVVLSIGAIAFFMAGYFAGCITVCNDALKRDAAWIKNGKFVWRSPKKVDGVKK